MNVDFKMTWKATIGHSLVECGLGWHLFYVKWTKDGHKNEVQNRKKVVKLIEAKANLDQDEDNGSEQDPPKSICMALYTHMCIYIEIWDRFSWALK